MLKSSADQHMLLLGQAPQVALEVANSSIQFCEPLAALLSCSAPWSNRMPLRSR